MGSKKIFPLLTLIPAYNYVGGTLGPLFSYRRFGAGLYPVWIASCSIMYLPVLVVP
jgi:hypothetical protein